MMRPFISLLLLVAGCGGVDGIHAAASHDTVTIPIGQELTFDAPPCKTFVRSRIDVRDPARAQYRVVYLTDGGEIDYVVDPRDADGYALRVEVTPSAAPAVVVRIDGSAGRSRLAVRDVGDAPLLDVTGFDGADAAATQATTRAPIAPSSLALLACALPYHSASDARLKGTPEMLENVSDAGYVDGANGVKGSGSERTPIVADWSSGLTFLQAFLLAGDAIRPDGSWRPDCIDGIGWCGAH